VVESSACRCVLRHSPLADPSCDEHPEKMTVAQAVDPRRDVPSEVQILLRQHLTLEISPLITILTSDWLQLGLVSSNRLTRSWSV
jgi:hypothetical protein